MQQPQTDLADRIHATLDCAVPPTSLHARVLDALAEASQRRPVRRRRLVVAAAAATTGIAASGVAVAAALHHNASVVLDRVPTIANAPPSQAGTVTPGFAFQVSPPVERARAVDVATAAQLAGFTVLRESRSDASLVSVQYVTFTVPNAPAGWSITVQPQVRLAYITPAGGLAIIEHADTRTGTAHAPAEPGNAVATHNGEQYVVASDSTGRVVSVSFSRGGVYFALTFSVAADPPVAWGFVDSLS